MNWNEYVSNIELKLSKYFDINRDVQFKTQQINLFAKAEIHQEKFFGTKNVKIWSAKNYEYLFLQVIEEISETKIETFQKFLICMIDELVKPHSEHMSSTFTGILVVDHFPASLEDQIKKFKYKKSFAFSLKGWADIRLLVIDLNSKRVIHNKKGKEVATFYQPMRTSLKFIQN
ncbi:hypothetical protein [Tepidibacillus sp. LV47]|uniref:hypothetical protein n=1 Tax=Tepidibacillus sp. LV47 TaxID=3398228 RepID=UPI003AAF90ED